GGPSTGLRLEAVRSFVLDLDPSSSCTRNENALLHLDAVHNPWTCFHLSLNWLNCTSRLINDLVQRWSVTAERCGMRLVEAPLVTDIAETHPFYSPITIKLALLPPDPAILVEHIKPRSPKPVPLAGPSKQPDSGPRQL
ncbi:vacuolar membrane-associated protein iml1, partial [Spiromyces aspiralis]